MRGETPSLHCLQDLHYPLRPRTNEWEGVGEGEGREWERERMNIKMKQPASVPDALGQVPTLVPHKQREGWVTATGRGWGQSMWVCVCVWARVHVRACMYLCVCSFQKRMSVWQVPQNYPSWLVIWVCILHINLYYSLSFSVISCLLMMNQTSFTISYQFYCFLKSERKDTELHWKKDIKTQLHLFSVYCIHRYPGWLNRGYFRF